MSTPSLMPHLPAELQRYILQLASQRALASSDPARSSVLRSFALVSRAWGEFAQYELFASDVVVLEHPHVATKFLGALALDRTGRLAGLVRRMRVKGASMGGFDNSGTSYRLGELQHACPNLEELALHSLVFSLESLCSSHVLRLLALEAVTMLPSDTPSTPSLPSLVGLALLKTWAGPELSSFVLPANLPSLQSLFVEGLGGDNSTLSAIPHFRDLGTLHLGPHEWNLLHLGGSNLSNLGKLKVLHVSASRSAQLLLRTVPHVLAHLEIHYLDQSLVGPYLSSLSLFPVEAIGDETSVTLWYDHQDHSMTRLAAVVSRSTWDLPHEFEFVDRGVFGGGMAELKEAIQ